MRWSASLALMLAANGGAADRPRAAPAPSPATAPDRQPAQPSLDPAPPPELAGAAGPSGTSGTGAEGYDSVGYASWYGEELTGNRTATGERFDAAAITAAHRTLPLGSYAEITALDTGRTIIVRINDRGPARRDREIDLSRGAMDQLGGKNAVVAVRVRGIVPSPSDIVALKSGQAAAPRLDAPPALLNALRKQLRGGPEPATAAAPPPSPRPEASASGGAAVGPATHPVAARPAVNKPVVTRSAPVSDRPVPATRGGYVVQVGTFSNEARARALARTLGGSVRPSGALWRVRLGPFPDSASAKRARDAAARRGYGDAQVQTEP